MRPALVLHQHPIGQQPGQGLLTGTTTKVGSQTDTAQAKGTLTSSMKQGRLEA
jgi:hypothetical protein